MAYLDRNGVVRTADQRKYDMPERGIFDELFTYLESFVAKTKRANSMNNSQLDALGREIRENVDKSMLLLYINSHLFRLNNYYDYDFTRNEEVGVLEVYKMIQTGEMRDIWSPIKAKKYNATYNITGYSEDAQEIYFYLGDDYTLKSENGYQRYVESCININKLMFELGANFYKLVRDINQIAQFSWKQTIQDCIKPTTNYTIHNLNPYNYIIDSEGRYFTTRDKIMEIARSFINTKSVSHRRKDVDSDKNYNSSDEIIDNVSVGLFFKPLNDDIKFIREYFMRYAVYSSSIEFEGNMTLTSRTSRTNAVKFCTDLGWIIDNLLPVVKRVTRLPTDHTKIEIPNNLFKKVNYLEMIKKGTKRFLGNRYFTEPTGVERGGIATVESLMRYLVINLGLKLNELVRYNPIVTPLGRKIGAPIIPVFGVRAEGTVFINVFSTTEIYNILSPITGAEETVNGKIYLDIYGEDSNNGDLTRGKLGLYTEVDNEIIIQVGSERYIEKIIERGKEIFKEGYSNKYDSLSGLRSYLEDTDFVRRFEQKYGEPPTRYHFIPISIVELIIRYLLGSVRSSSLLRLRYEPLTKDLLDVFNEKNHTKYPLGTKFLYISFYTNTENNATTNLVNYGRRLSEDDLLNTHINSGYSNKWGVTDQEILSAINKLERLGDHAVLNKETLDVIVDVVYKLVINYISVPSREEGFRDKIDKKMERNRYYNDQDIRRHILLPLLDDMRKNSDFS